MPKIILPIFVILSLLIKPAFAFTGEQNFLLFYSNDVRGETEPCG